jgi:hypothetical protein
VFFILLFNSQIGCKVTTYKADRKTDIYYTIGIILLLSITVPLSSRFSPNSWPFLVIFLLAFLLFNISTSRLNEIQLDEINGSIALIFKNWITLKKTVKYSLNEIEFTYKRQASSFRSGIKNICTIYHAGKKVILIIPGTDNWSDDEIRNFVHGLVECGIKKKFIGYSLKDAEI